MSAKVVKAKGHDSVLIEKSNPDYASVMVIETRAKFSNGFMNTQNRVGFITGKTEDMQRANFYDGQELKVKVVYKETLDPTYEGQEPKRYPEGHPKAGEVVTSGGAPVYLTRIVCDETSPEQDSLLLTDREEIAVETKVPATEFASKK